MCKKIYLATPYTKIDMDFAFETVNKIAAELITKGYRVFSPITFGHCITQHLPKEKQTDSQFWLNQFLPEMETCDELLLVVLGENGKQYIKESKGCQAEISKAMELRISIKYHYFDGQKTVNFSD